MSFEFIWWIMINNVVFIIKCTHPSLACIVRVKLYHQTIYGSAIRMSNEAVLMLRFVKFSKWKWHSLVRFGIVADLCRISCSSSSSKPNHTPWNTHTYLFCFVLLWIYHKFFGTSCDWFIHIIMLHWPLGEHIMVRNIKWYAGIIFGMSSAKERQRYLVTSSAICWVQTQNDLWLQQYTKKPTNVQNWCAIEHNLINTSGSKLCDIIHNPYPSPHRHYQERSLRQTSMFF